MNKDLKNIFNEIPDFLAILGFQDAYLDENDEWVIENSTETNSIILN